MIMSRPTPLSSRRRANSSPPTLPATPLPRTPFCVTPAKRGLASAEKTKQTADREEGLTADGYPNRPTIWNTPIRRLGRRHVWPQRETIEEDPETPVSTTRGLFNTPARRLGPDLTRLNEVIEKDARIAELEKERASLLEENECLRMEKDCLLSELDKERGARRQAHMYMDSLEVKVRELAS